jgi:predicted RNA-binding Zn-ribbon protein involved in translation (DUF1610 family)
MSSHQPNPDLDGQIGRRRVTTNRRVIGGGPVSSGQPVIETRQTRTLTSAGITDETEVIQHSCASCGKEFQDEAASRARCVICGRTICADCTNTYRCITCGHSACKTHSVTIFQRTRCIRHFLRRAVGWIIVLTILALVAQHLAQDGPFLSRLHNEIAPLLGRLLPAYR